MSETVLGEVKDAASWVRLSPQESAKLSSRDCSSHPFKHCCLGQCRNEINQLSKNDALWKLSNRNLASMSDVLGRFASNIQRKPDSSCNIFFAGDSLSSDTAMGANCQLLSSGYKLMSCNTKTMGGAKYGSDLTKECKSNFHPTLDHFMLENENAKSCRKVTIFYSALQTAAAHLKYNKDVNDVGGLFVFNRGVHCNEEGVGCISSFLRSHIFPMVRGENATIYKQWKLLYRETEPQHFDRQVVVVMSS